jgi:hypothetical protein
MKDWKEWVLALMATSWVMSAAPKTWEVMLPIAEAGIRDVLRANTLLIFGSGPHQLGTPGESEPSIKLATLDPTAFSLNVTDFLNGSVRNNVLHLSYNRAQDGSQETPGEPSLSLALQSRFPLSGQDYMGYTVDYTSADGLVNRRFLELDVNRSNHSGRWNFAGDEIGFAPQVPLRLQTLDPGRFSIYVTSFVNEDARDNILYIGYNRTRVGEPEILGEPSLSLEMESRFRISGEEFMEYNMDYTAADGLTHRRFLGFDVNRSSHLGRWAFAGAAIRLEAEINGEHFMFLPRGDRKTIIRYAGGANELMQIGYDGGPSAPNAIQIGPSALSRPEFEAKNLNLTNPGELAVSFYGNYGTPGLKQVRVGPSDSGGLGFRALVVPND